MSLLIANSKFNGDISKWNASKAVNRFTMFDDSPLEHNPEYKPIFM